MNKEIGVGFVGAGNVAELHEQAIRAIAGARLVGLIAATADETRRRAAQWGVDAYSALDRMLEDPRVEVVYVLTPLEHHVEHATRAMRAGKHVVIEKPVAPSPAEVRELQHVATDCKVKCLPGHNYVYAPEIRRGRRLIERGDLGTICGLWVHFAIFHPEEMVRTWPGALRQVGTHFFYLLQYLFGERPRKLFASKSCLHYKELTQEDQFMVQLEMPRGALASLFCTFACDDNTADPWSFHVKVLGTNGGFSYTWRSAIFNRALGTLSTAIVPYEETFREMDEYLLGKCIALSEDPLSPLEHAEGAAELIDCAEESTRTGSPVDCGLD